MTVKRRQILPAIALVCLLGLIGAWAWWWPWNFVIWLAVMTTAAFFREDQDLAPHLHARREYRYPP
jgi:hypothetical protein